MRLFSLVYYSLFCRKSEKGRNFECIYLSMCGDFGSISYCTFRSVRLSGLEVYFILYIYIYIFFFFFPKELDHTHTVRGRASLKKSGLQLLTVTEVNLTFSILVLYCNVMYDKANFSVRFSMDNSEIKREGFDL